MSFENYNTKVKVGTIEIPVDSVRIYPEPYVPSGSTALELFDGRRILKQPTFGYRIELEWNELRNSYDKVWDAISYLLTNDGGTFYAYYNPSTGSFDGTKTITNVIPQLTDEDIGVIFEGRIRKKPARLTLVSKTQGVLPASLPTWITG